MPNHQLNSAPNFIESDINRLHGGREGGLILSSFTRDGGIAVWIQAFERAMGALFRDRTHWPVIHMPAQDPASLTTAVKHGFRTLREKIAANELHLWSGGWSGAPGALLSREELEWEIRWGDGNPEDGGLEQLFRVRPKVLFPTLISPSQALHLWEQDGRPVCGGYSTHPVPGTITPLWLYRRAHWYRAPALLLDIRRPETLPVLIPDLEDQSRLILHLVIPPTPFEDLPDPAAVAEAVAPVFEGRSAGPCFETVPDGNGETPGLFVETFPLRSAVSLPLAPGIIGPLRGAARLNHDRVSGVLRGLSPYRMHGPTPVALVGASAMRREPLDFQGSTEGHLAMSEGDLGVRFASGRIAGITVKGGVGTVSRRALGFLRRDEGSIPSTVFLETHQAAWFSSTRSRGVEELALLPCGPEPIELKTTAVLAEEAPGLLISYCLKFPARIPAGPVSASLFSIPILFRDETEDYTIELFDGDGVPGRLQIPPRPGRWTVMAWLLRFPLGGDAGIYIGAAEPGRRLAISMEVRQTRTDRGLLLSADPIWRHRGELPHELSGVKMTGTILLADGSGEVTDLQVQSGTLDSLLRFNLTVPA